MNFSRKIKKEVKVIYCMKKILLFLILLFVFGCVQPILSENCDNNSDCMNLALTQCKNAHGFQEITNQNGINKAILMGEIKKISDTNCFFSYSLNELSFSEETLQANINSSYSQFPLFSSDELKNFFNNLATLFSAKLNNKIAKKLPIKIECYAKIDGNVMLEDLAKCNKKQSEKILSLLQTEMKNLVNEIIEEINAQQENLKEQALKLGEINKTEYKQATEKTNLFSGGVTYARAFTPNNTEATITQIVFDELKINYSITGLNENTFAVIHVITDLNTSEKASEKYKKILNKFLNTQSSEKIIEKFHGENSIITKIKINSNLDAYRLFYQEKKYLIVIDLIPKEMQLLKVIEIMKNISNTLNKRLNPESKDIKISCETKIRTEEKCETIQENQEYQEQECNTRQYNYQATKTKGTSSEGFLGMGCYTKVETTVSNQENIGGAFTLKVNFLDNQQNTITTKQTSQIIPANSTQTLIVQYDYKCTSTKPEHYTHQLEIPTNQFCETITKIKQVPKEICKQKEIEEIKCKKV